MADEAAARAHVFRSDHDALEHAEWEIDRVERSMLVVSCAIGARPTDTSASIRDADLDGMMCMLAERLKAARTIINAVISNGLEGVKEGGNRISPEVQAEIRRMFSRSE